VFTSKTWNEQRPNKLRLTIFVAREGEKAAYFAISFFGRIGSDSLPRLLSGTQKLQQRDLRLTRTTITNGKRSPADCTPSGESVDLCTLEN